MPLIFLRHSRPDAPDDLCYGRTDLALGDDFDAAADHLVRTLPDISEVATSPLSRCNRLARVIANEREIPLRVEPNLVEIDFGNWENTLWDAIPRAEIDLWANDFFEARPHGGESVEMLRLRTRNALAKRGVGPTLWVSHAGVYRAVLAETDHPDPWNARLDFGAFVTLEIP